VSDGISSVVYITIFWTRLPLFPLIMKT